MKCPMSAPPKSSKPRVSKQALISSLSRKFVDEKGGVTKPQPTRTSSSTPKPKTKQVAAKYLTTPRNRKCLQIETSFRSVQHPKPGATASKDRRVVKALVFHSPKRSISIKTSVELKTPLSKLRSQKKSAGLLRKRVTFKEESSEKIRSGAQTEKAKVESSSRSKQISTKRVADKGLKLTHTNEKPKESEGGEIASCTEPTSTLNSDLTTLDVSRELENPPNSKPNPVKEDDLPESQVSNIEDAPGGVGIESEVTYRDDKENELPKSEVTNIENAPLGVGVGSEVADSDDKENSSAIDANRCLKKTSGEARTKIMHNGRGKSTKDVQPMDKSVKEGIVSMKVKKPKPTNPKPFRFRTDERGILKEAANMEKKHLLGSKTEPAKPFMEGKSKRKQAKDIQGDEKFEDKCNSATLKYCSKMPERKILAELTSGETIQVVQEGMEFAAATPNRLMQTRKKTSPLKRETPEREAKSSLLAPAQKLNMIKEITSPVTRQRKTINRKENRATGYQPSQKRLTVTVPKEPNFRTAHRPKSCTKQVV